ncbi:MAG TPA: tetratricopeptide repeat protein [Chitinophagales bacterium]|nr:tetratricopeptide repeat protein [Chitinophagales bacterium]
MNKIISIVLTLSISISVAFAQSNKLDKKLDKAHSLADNGKTDEADEYLVKVLRENPEYGAGWDYLCDLRYQEYQSSKMMDQLLGGAMTVTTKDKDGNEVKDDSLAKNLMNMLNNIRPSKLAFNKYKYTMRKATLMSNEAYRASTMLRIRFIDTEVDSEVSKKALKYFDDAEKEFVNKDYSSAAKLYKRAVSEQPDFYKASLYLGDCYFFMGNYTEAIKSFQEAVNRFPTFLEPRKYLVDAYMKEKLYERALQESILTMAVYPDLAMTGKLDDAAYMNNQKLDIKWTARGVFPNRIGLDSSDMFYNDPDSIVVKQPWTFYEDAMEQIEDYCDDRGVIVKPNQLTESHYLEVFCWEQMLKNSNDPLLEEARRMQKDGYLDCYVMVTCFHFDIYDQYADFVSKNKSKVEKYFNNYIVYASK